MTAEAARADALPLFVIIDGAVGPVHPDLVASWDSSSAGSPCARCAAILEDELTGLECPGCMREYAIARGCKCAGTNLCPACIEHGATPAVGTVEKNDAEAVTWCWL